MFLLECAQDNSLLIKRNESVLCDHNTVAPGDVVAFDHKKTKYHGTVRMIADEDALRAEIEKIRSADRRNIRISKVKPVSPLGKRIPTRKRKWSPELSAEKKMRVKKSTKAGKHSGITDEQLIDDSTDSLSDDGTTIKSANKQIDNEEFSLKSSEMDKVNLDFDNSRNRPPLEKLTNTPLSSRSRNLSLSRRSRSPFSRRKSRSPLFCRGLESPGSIAHNQLVLDENAMRKAAPANSTHTEALDDDGDDDVEQGQLYSSEGINNMKHIGNGIYCKKADYKNAVRGTPSATAVARNLLVGVFKKEVLVQGSVAGRSPRAQGLERMKQENVRLHDKATKTIIKFAQDYAKKRNWSSDASDSKIKSAMAQKIVELKGENSKNSSIPIATNP